MSVPSLIQRLFQRLADTVSERRSFPVPDRWRLDAARIISHRGSHDNRRTLENTLAAFDQAAGAGVWGFEMDIRWTRDLEPVVFHDIDLDRLYGHKKSVASLPLADLKKLYPAIPALSEVVSKYGKKFHLMIEIKEQPWPARQVQEQRLAEVLQSLDPVRDYHFLALDPAVLQSFSRVPPQVRVAIADGFPSFSSRWVRRHRWGGICGHYLLMGNAMVRHHQRLNQQVGTGYVRSRNCLFRELNRGVDWIFTNHAVVLQDMLNLLTTMR